MQIFLREIKYFSQINVQIVLHLAVWPKLYLPDLGNGDLGTLVILVVLMRTWCGQTGRIAADFSLHPSHIPDACMVLHSGSVVQYARVCGPSVPVLLLRCLLVLTCNPASRVTVYLDSGGLCSDTSQGLHMSTRHLD